MSQLGEKRDKLDRVVEFLRNNRRWFTIKELKVPCPDLNSVLAELKSHKKIHCKQAAKEGEVDTYAYRAVFPEIINREKLIEKFETRHAGDGLKASDLADAYPAVKDDLKAMVEAGKLLIIASETRQVKEETYFWRGSMLKEFEAISKAAIPSAQAMWRDVKVNRSTLDEELLKAGIQTKIGLMQQKRAINQINAAQSGPAKRKRKKPGDGAASAAAGKSQGFD